VSLSVRNNIWEIAHPSEKEALLLSQKKQIDINIANLLVNRGITIDDYDFFINPSLKEQMPDPFILKDCEKACKIIADSIENKEKIVIYGDYDVDGGTSTSVFVRFLRSVGVETDFYIPNKLEEGYGPNVNAFAKLKEQGTDLLITVDCGISAFEAIDNAPFKTIISDHHMAEEKLPKALAIVNPKRLDDTSGLDGIAGVAVTFLLCVAVNRELEERGYFNNKIEKPNLCDLLDLVALGTICDVMKLTDINRVFVAQGLKILNRKTNVGLKALCDFLEINKEIESYHLGFVLGPRLNAGGRLGNSRIATELLICEDYNKAIRLAEKLEEYNNTRKEIESLMYEEAMASLDKDIEVYDLKDNHAFVYDKNWHSGVLGIVASRLKEKFGKPSFAVTCDDGIAHGSARSIKGVDLGAIVVLAKQKGILKDGGGHKMAAGFSCPIERLEDFQNFIREQIDSQLNGKEVYTSIFIDAITSIRGANLELLDMIDKIAPFGNANSRPKFCIKNLDISKTMVLKDKHVKCFFSSKYEKGTLEGIIFNAVDGRLGDFLLQKHDKPIDVVGCLDKNSWNGRETVQFLIEDAKYSESDSE